MSEEGKDVSGGGHTRPRALTAKHVDALKKGETVDLDKIEELPPTDAKAAAAAAAAARPHPHNADDVKAAREGKDLGLDKRERLKSQ